MLTLIQQALNVAKEENMSILEIEPFKREQIISEIKQKYLVRGFRSFFLWENLKSAFSFTDFHSWILLEDYIKNKKVIMVF